MHAGKTEQAEALAARIGKQITKHNTAQFKCIDAKADASDMWHKVKQLSSRSGRSDSNCSLTADQLNKHYATISHDISYSIPVPKSTDGRLPHVMYEWEIFYILDHLKHTAPGWINFQPGFCELELLFFQVSLPNCLTCHCKFQLYLSNGNQHVSFLCKKNTAYDLF